MDGGRLVRRIENDLNTLNYLLHTTEQERVVLSYVFDPIVDLDRELRPIPALASRWQISEDGRSYTLHLDPQATFSDGTPVKAGDVLFTIRTIVDEKSPQFFAWFDGFDAANSKVVDDRTVVVAFREARAGQLLSFNVAVLPEHVYGKGDFNKDHNDTAVGSGPYTVAERVRGNTILLKRRPDYWRARPHVDSVLFQILGEDAVAWRALQTGAIDEMRVKTDVWAAAKDRVGRDIAFYDAWLLQYNCVAWNNRNPLLRDPRVRNALAMLFDRQAIIDGLYKGQARPISGPSTPDQWAYNATVKPIEYQPDAAKALLQAAGWTDSNGDGVLDSRGRKFSFEMLIPAGNSLASEQMQGYQQSLKNAGVQMEIRSLDGAAFFERIMQGNYQSAALAWTVDPDPDLYSLFHSSQQPPDGLNVVWYSNPEVDRLIEQGRRELDAGQRRDIYHQIHAILARDQPYLWTIQVGAKWGVNKRVRNVDVSKGFGLFNWYPGPFAWWLEPRLAKK